MLILLALLLTACGANSRPTHRSQITLVAPEALPTSSLTDPVLLDGKANYDLYCAHCHGYSGEGQIAESLQVTLDLGMITVPPHDSTGHTWQHPDQLLLRVTREGVVNPLAQYPMPPFAGTLTDEQIMNIYAYIRLWWTDEQRAHQQRVTERWNEIAQAPAATAQP